ncbi:hypothetical protein [Marivirga lumbricoides]|uniref:hypothetical protein n=1 Tax=Marivirga lumbricoides TaxID=1046115 RepID=UPI0016690204
MKKILLEFLKLLLIAIVQISLIFIFSSTESLAFLVHESAYLMVGFLFVSMSFIHFVNGIAFRLEPHKRGGQLFAAIIMRLLMSLVFVLIMVYFGIEHKVTFALNFFVLYLSYMLFEIKGVMTNLREISATTDKAFKND